MSEHLHAHGPLPRRAPFLARGLEAHPRTGSWRPEDRIIQQVSTGRLALSAANFQHTAPELRMKSIDKLYWHAIFALTSISVASAASAATVSEVLVVENSSSATSVAIGGDYMLRRGVSNLVQVNCQDSATSRDNETIPAADYKSRIETPIRNYLKTHPQINFIVLTKGVPIRIDGGETGEQYNGDPVPGLAQESLDSALASLDYATLPGATKITFNDPSGSAVGTAWLNRYWNAAEPFSHQKFGGYIVTRLDAFTKAQAMGLTAKAAAAELKLTHGPILLDIEPDFGVDDPQTQPAPITTQLITQESGYSTWNADMQHAASDLGTRGFETLVNTQPAFVGNIKNLLGYYSWGSNDDHWSADAYHSLGFLPGAIGDTAVSTSAMTMLVPGSDGQSAIGDLIAQGITGVKGYINEPLLQAISSPTITLNRYTRGYTLGESFFAGSHFVGWTDLVMGDPLAHPYSAHGAQLVPGITVSFQAMANGDDVTAESAGAKPLIANRTAIGTWEKFQVVDAGNGNIALKSLANHLYVTAENGGSSPLIANRKAIGTWETFTEVPEANGKIGLLAMANGKYVTAENAGSSALIANRNSVGTWETFTVTVQK